MPRYRSAPGVATSPLCVPAAEMRRRLCAWATKFGVDLHEVARELNMPLATFQGRGTGEVGLADYFRVLERLQIASHDESWLSRRPLLLGSTELVLSNLAHCATILLCGPWPTLTICSMVGNTTVWKGARSASSTSSTTDVSTRGKRDHAYVRFMMECVLDLPTRPAESDLGREARRGHCAVSSPRARSSTVMSTQSPGGCLSAGMRRIMR